MGVPAPARGPRWPRGSAVRAAPSGLLLLRRWACFRQRWLWNDSVPKAGPKGRRPCPAVIHPRSVGSQKPGVPLGAAAPCARWSAFEHPGSVPLGMSTARSVPYSKVTASLVPSCSGNSEPNSVWDTVATQELLNAVWKVNGRKVMLLVKLKTPSGALTSRYPHSRKAGRVLARRNCPHLLDAGVGFGHGRLIKEVPYLFVAFIIRKWSLYMWSL